MLMSIACPWRGPERGKWKGSRFCEHLPIWNDGCLGSPRFCLPRRPQHCPSIQSISPTFSFTHLKPCFSLLSLSYYFKWAKPFSNSVSIFSLNLSVPIILGNFMVNVDNQSNQPGRNQICNEEPSTLPLTHDFWQMIFLPTVHAFN